MACGRESLFTSSTVPRAVGAASSASLLGTEIAKAGSTSAGRVVRSRVATHASTGPHLAPAGGPRLLRPAAAAVSRPARGACAPHPRARAAARCGWLPLLPALAAPGVRAPEPAVRVRGVPGVPAGRGHASQSCPGARDDSRARGTERPAAGRPIEPDRFPGVGSRIHRRSPTGLQSSEPDPACRRADRVHLAAVRFEHRDRDWGWRGPAAGARRVERRLPAIVDAAGGLVLAAVVGLYAGLRRALGNAIQRRFFMAVDFADVSLRDLRHVPPGVFDRGPVVFVETIVRPRSSSGHAGADTGRNAGR